LGRWPASQLSNRTNRLESQQGRFLSLEDNMKFYCPKCGEIRVIDDDSPLGMMIEIGMTFDCPCCLNKYRVDLVMVEDVEDGNG
jgi:predicted RNA-binding Zn-ribbon protein involved in translation (DUF1610 family)